MQLESGAGVVYVNGLKTSRRVSPRSPAQHRGWAGRRSDRAHAISPC